MSADDPLLWTLSAPNARGERTTFHHDDEGTVRVVEESGYLALQRAIAERDRLAEMNTETVRRTTDENLRLRALRTAIDLLDCDSFDGSEIDSLRALTGP